MSRKLCRSENAYAARSASTLAYGNVTPLRCASAKISSGSSEPSMWMWSSALGIVRNSSGTRSRGMVSKAMVIVHPSKRRGRQRRPRCPRRRSRSRSLLLVAARDLAFHALDVEVDAAEELVVGRGVLGEHFLAFVAGERALPDHEAAVLQAGLGG